MEEPSVRDATPTLVPVSTPLNLIPVGLKEAALDSPTFRATALHFSDQIEAVEKWLDGYVKTGTKLAHDFAALEPLVNTFLQQTVPPPQVSEAVLDHDYTLLATKRYGEASREYWQLIFRGLKKSDATVIEPIRQFLNNELRSFKDARRVLEAAQKAFDTVLARYSGQGKSKEPSSLREDAFQLHETRKSYLKASMDFCVQGPQVRAALDKLLVKVFSDHWKEFRAARETSQNMFTKWGSEMERVRGWSKEMEHSERAFKRELQLARTQIEDSAEQMARPSRELEDYATSTVPYLGSSGPATGSLASPAKPAAPRPDKQGWLYLKSVTGKPARTLWSRRWFFVKNGIFGWLVQGARSGGVEESEKVGVLLCNVRPALQEERRFCFEVKTKDTTITLQAETQESLIHWMGSFEVAKRKALENPASSESSLTPGVDPAFAISPPVAPELAAKGGEALIAQGGEDGIAGLAAPDRDLATRSSIDVSSGRRSTVVEREGEGSRETAARIMQKLDLHRRATPSATVTPAPAGGIASLISASHNILPVGPVTQPPGLTESRSLSIPASTLAPSTLANPPAATSLSKTAVVISGERGVSLGRADGSGMPSGIMANLWGSTNWGRVNRLDQVQEENKPNTSFAIEPIPSPLGISTDDVGIMDGTNKTFGTATTEARTPSTRLGLGHRKSISMSTETRLQAGPPLTKVEPFPNYYPLPLKAQDAQFRILFPEVPWSEKVVLVFRATWNPSEQQEFPGRVYVTAKEMYFYSNHMGLVLVSSISLSSITDVTAAPGRDCDFLFVHLYENSKAASSPRLTIKTFLEPLKLLQRRLNYLVANAHHEVPDSLEEVIKSLIRMEADDLATSPDMESWEGAFSQGEESELRPPRRREHDLKATLRIDGDLYGGVAKTGREVQRFKLPAQAVVYSPQDMPLASVVRDFSISAKALFHVMFGDKSAVFQMLYRTRQADSITQTPWTQPEGGHLSRRLVCDFGSNQVTDVQTIDIQNEHLCYVVTETKTAWQLPMSSSFFLTTKFVITHSAKSKCKFAIYHKVVWSKAKGLAHSRRLVGQRAMKELEADATVLSAVAMNQVAKLGARSKTNKAITIFGNVGQATQAAQIAGADLPVSGGAARPTAKQCSLASLYADDALLQLLRMLSVVLSVVVALAKGIAGAASAHLLLVVLLVLSGTYNTWYGYRDGLTWYHERNAAKFMGRLGVGADPTVSRAVYLVDISDMYASPSLARLSGNDTAGVDVGHDEASVTCRTTFQDVVTMTERETAATYKGAARRTEARLQRTRHQLARYRHDLLVAMRLVNRVEKEVVQAEWEDWVKEESDKCAKVQKMLKKGESRVKGAAKGKDTKGTTAGTDDEQDLASLGSELHAYCASCSGEVEALKQGKGALL